MKAKVANMMLFWVSNEEGNLSLIEVNNSYHKFKTTVVEIQETMVQIRGW